MPLDPIVVKLGGDALATPERLAAQARRLARRARSEPIVAVASARRGVTDHLLGLVRDVREAAGGGEEAGAEADRAVAAGEGVTSALLALALNQCGVSAVSLDARDAGITAAGSFGDASIEAVAVHRLHRLLRRGILPVVTGFQGWRNGRVATLGRGGSDTSAVFLATALGAGRCEFVKDSTGLLTADPAVVPDARPIPRASHRFLTTLASAGAQVMHPRAATLAEAGRLPLAFYPLEGDTALSLIGESVGDERVWAVAARELSAEAGEITLVQEGSTPEHPRDSIEPALVHAGIRILGWSSEEGALRIVVPLTETAEAARALHRWSVGESAPALARRAS